MYGEYSNNYFQLVEFLFGRACRVVLDVDQSADEISTLLRLMIAVFNQLQCLLSKLH